MRKLSDRQSEPVKILFVLPNLDLAGAQKVVVELIRGLDRSRYAPIVCCLQGFGYYEDLLRQWGVQLFEIRPSGLHDLRFVWRIKRLIQQNDIQLVNTHQHLFDFWVAVSSRLAGVPCVVTKHSLYEPHQGWERIVRLTLERLIQRLANRYVTISEAARDHFMSAYDLRGDAIEVIHNGLIFDQYEPDSRLRQKMREKLEVSSNQFLIGTVANLRATKGYVTFLEALPSIIEVYPGVVFIWVGRNVGGFKERLEQRAGNLGVRNCIQFTGKRNDVPDILRALDLFVLPSHKEGLPMVILEAMAAGVPVVATTVGGVPEIITDGRSGLLVQPRDEAELSSAIIELIKDREKAQEMACIGRDYVLEKFSMHRMAMRYQEIFDACIASGNVHSNV